MRHIFFEYAKQSIMINGVRTEQVLIELDISAIEKYVIIKSSNHSNHTSFVEM